MTPIDPFERRLPDGLTELANPRVPSYLDEILADTGRARQRPAWSFLERWLPMALIERRPATAPPLRAAWVLLLAALLVLTIAASSLIAGARLITAMLPNADSHQVAVLLPTACPKGATLKSGDIVTVAGTGAAGAAAFQATVGDGGPAVAATLSSPYGIAVDSKGAIYVGDSTGYYGTGVSHGIRKIGPDGVITTAVPASVNGTVFQAPVGLAVDARDDLYFADFHSGGQIWKVDSAGGVTPVVGNGTIGDAGDGGPALDAQTNAVTVAFGPKGEIYFDGYWEPWRYVDPAGVVHLFAGVKSDSGPQGYSGDGGPATLALFAGGTQASQIAADRAGNVYLPDVANYRIRKVDTAGIITTVAGNGMTGYQGDGGKATDAAIGVSHGLAVDDAGDIYFSSYNQTVRKVDKDGIVTTVAGTGVKGYAGDCGPATDSQLDNPNGLAVRDGVLYIVDAGNYRIRMVVP